MVYRIHHRTTYKYAYPVSVGNHVACLLPRSYATNFVRWSTLHMEPAPVTMTERRDFFGNCLCFFTIEEPHTELLVEARSEVVRTSDPPLSTGESLPWEQSTTALAADFGDKARNETGTQALTIPQRLDTLDALQYQFESPRIRMQPDYAAYALVSFTPGRPLREALRELTTRIHRDFVYDGKATTVRTPTEEAFRKRRGVCQDFAHVQIACLRSIGIAARYVSGYLRTYPPPGKPRLIGADASHAWLAAYDRALGWLDMDPTNDVAPTDGHVTLAWGRDYGDVSPLRGLILGGGGHTLNVEVDMEPVEG